MCSEHEFLSWQSIQQLIRNYSTWYFWQKIGKKSGADAHWQFKITDADGKRIGMMLNTDFGLLYDLKLNDESRSTCPVSAGAQEKCTRVSTYGKALEYSEVSQQKNHYTTWKFLQCNL